jgi:transglutaminase-like putative cysteine protease
MRLTSLFRFSSYLCLTLSTACLGLAESAQIEGTAIFYIAICLLLLGEYLTADRWLMPPGIANTVAILIVVGWLVWFALGYQTGSDDPLGQLLPRAGPLLGVLMVAKLLRPKEVSDYWMLHLLGLVQVMLATVLALQSRVDRESPLFALLLLGYALSLIWAMLHFYLYRESVAARPARKGVKPDRALALPPALAPLAPSRALGAGSSVAWFILAFALGLTVFFAIPRPGADTSASLLLPGAARAQTGFNPGMDLNETTPIEVSQELVMWVEATDSQGRKVPLDCDLQRWRGVTCNLYKDGRWAPTRTPESRVMQVSADGPLASGQLRLRFNLDPAQVQSGWSMSENERYEDVLDRPTNQPVFIAEPAANTRFHPIVAIEKGRNESPLLMLTYRLREGTLAFPMQRRSRPLPYLQIYDLPSDTQLTWSQGTDFRLLNPPANTYWESLQAMPLSAEDAQKLADRAQELLKDAKIDPTPLREGKLTGAAKRELRIAIAKALQDRLANSVEEYGYTLDRPRVDMNIDPTVDFLCNTKQGHCGLYASGLALMLRSQGVPARVVIGFRGAHWNSMREVHEVYQYHAHAWVEAFIEDPNSPLIEPPPPGSNAAAATTILGRWMTLDPTPGGGTAGVAGPISQSYLADNINFLQYLWEFYLLDYNGEQQRERLLNQINKTLSVSELRSYWETMLALVESLGIAWLVVGAVVLVGLVILLGFLLSLWRRRVRKQRRFRALVPFYGRFLQLMERLRLFVRPEQTPAEFGEQAKRQLAGEPRTRDAIATPALVVDQLYDVRYGGHPAEPADLERIDSALDRLEAALKQR